MIPTRIFAKYFGFIGTLIDVDNNDTVDTLLKDLDMDNIMIPDDFVCTASLLIKNNVYGAPDCELTMLAKRRVMQQQKSVRFVALSKIMDKLAAIQDSYVSCTCTAMHDSCNICSKMHGIGHNSNDEKNNINAIISSLEKYRDNSTSEWISIRDKFIKSTDIAGFLTTCDKLLMTSPIDSILKLRIQLHTSPLVLINATTDMYDNNVIINAFNDGYTLIYSNALDYSERASYINAFDHCLHVTKITDIDTDEIETVHENLCTDLITSMCIRNKPNTNISLHKYVSLMSLEFIGIGNFSKIDISNNNILRKIDISYCASKKLLKENFFPNSLRELSLSTSSLNISKKCLNNCICIEKLLCDNNREITTCEPFACSLRILSASGCDSGITDDGLKKCINIEKLNCTDNKQITTCEQFAHTLRVLSASNNSGICDDGIKRCIYIEELDCSENNGITTCAPFAKSLRILHANKNKQISDDGLAKCKHIEELQCTDTDNITTCKPFYKTLRKLNAESSKITDDDIGLCTNISVIICDRLNITTLSSCIHRITLYTNNKLMVKKTPNLDVCVTKSKSMATRLFADLDKHFAL